MESLSDAKIDRQPYSGRLVFQDVKFLRKIKIAISYRAFMMWPTIIFEKCQFLLNLWKINFTTKKIYISNLCSKLKKNQFRDKHDSHARLKLGGPVMYGECPFKEHHPFKTMITFL